MGLIDSLAGAFGGTNRSPLNDISTVATPSDLVQAGEIPTNLEQYGRVNG